MPEVEVGLGAVFGDVAFSVFIGIQRSRIDVDVRIQLLDRYFIAPGLQQPREGCGDNPLSQRRGDASGDKDKFRFVRVTHSHVFTLPAYLSC